MIINLNKIEGNQLKLALNGDVRLIKLHGETYLQVDDGSVTLKNDWHIPQFTHDCSNCLFLFRLTGKQIKGINASYDPLISIYEQDCDCYVCFRPDGSYTVIARFSSSPEDCTSWTVFGAEEIVVPVPLYQFLIQRVEELFKGLRADLRDNYIEVQNQSNKIVR